MKLITTLLVAALLCPAFSAFAQPGNSNETIQRQPTEYVVSGILRSGDEGVVIKLVQGVQFALSRDEAADAFTQEVLSAYPGYTLIDTLVTPLTVLESKGGETI